MGVILRNPEIEVFSVFRDHQIIANSFGIQPSQHSITSGLPFDGFIKFAGIVVEIVNIQFQEPRLQTGA